MIRTLLRWPIQGYRRFISPLKPPTCRYLPTCSQYALDALEQHGAVSGSWLAVKRICRCHPWGGSGYDPVPPLCGICPVSPGRDRADTVRAP